MIQIITVLIIFISFPCNIKSNIDDNAAIEYNDTLRTWKEIKAQIEHMNESTTYDQIIQVLGKPYNEYATPSLPEEYVLYFNVPEEPEYIYWIMLNTQTKTFLYWSSERTKKE